MINKKLLQEENGGPVTTEYVIFVGFIGIVMAVGVTVLFNAMRNLFTAWAGYFTGP